MKNIKNERGSLALFVTIAMLFFMAFLLALFLSTANEQKTQLAVTARIKETYEQDLDNVEEIYNNFVGTEEYIPIYTAEQLKKVGTGENVYISEIGKYYIFNLNSKYILKNNIELNPNKYTVAEDGTITFITSNAEQWTPIGTSENPFTGIFDGNGYRISGVYINNIETEGQGLFGYTKLAIIKNLGVINSNVIGGNRTGMIVGYAYKGTITNCYSKANLTGTSNIGGIIGVNYANISNCFNISIVSANNCNIGGIVGNNQGTINQCYNIGKISSTRVSEISTANSRTGGISGYNNGDVTNCYNIGDISGTCAYVGGIIGWNYSTTNNINSCYNEGNITCSTYGAGGICGRNDANLTNCYNKGIISAIDQNIGGIVGQATATSVVQNCYNIGKVVKQGEFYGEILGKNLGNITNCFYLEKENDNVGGINGADVEGQAEVRTSDEMKTSDFVTLLNNGKSNWKIVTGKNDDYPILIWQN